jgi:putative Mn2+ efflux pump MntP
MVKLQEELVMGLLEVVLIALGLSMDAFAVSVTLGLSVQKPKIREIMIPGIFFGFFQALMPTIGYFAGIFFADKIQNFDHWIAFALLGIIGGKMIKESLSKKEKETNENSFKLINMIILAIATSIDALAIGITFAFFKVNIFKAVVITGIITFFISMTGVKIGNIFGSKFKSKAEFAGGAILVILGIKIVAEHLFFNGG